LGASKELFGILHLIDDIGTLKYRKRLQKLVLVGKLEFKYPFSFAYEKYLFGPYSLELQNYVDKLVLDGLVKEISKENFYEYELSPTGKLVLDKMKKEIPNEIIQKIDELVANYGNMALPKLVQKAKELYQ